MPPLLLRPGFTIGFHLPLTPILSNSDARVNQYSQSFLHFSSKLWNSLPVSVFLTYYDLTLFKREVSRHLSLSFDYSSIGSVRKPANLCFNTPPPGCNSSTKTKTCSTLERTPEPSATAVLPTQPTSSPLRPPTPSTKTLYSRMKSLRI
ncbi:hypothetical protein E2C01_003757 [Portunus trituberculatus]|uniref:Uncharacterized protein n=1 Tax=Portunus trituberculatus TaxID=210409 RepID=A0A5B7CR18_PORTR|nr:hypothetical protein [Portunus trituberculatus]